MVIATLTPLVSRSHSCDTVTVPNDASNPKPPPKPSDIVGAPKRVVDLSDAQSLELAKTGAPPRLSTGSETEQVITARDRAAGAAEAKFREEAFAPGQVLGSRYRVIARLGAGGMGEVYRAEDMVLGAEVALKFIADVLSNDAVSRERLAVEVRTARRVTHPNVCRVHDLGDIGGRRFISMEYIDGEDLSTLLRRIGRLPSDKGLEIGRQIGEALHAAHGQEVLHRDLKPSNVLLDGKGSARLVDFGLAALTSEVKRGDGTLIGTPAYMSPEQLAGKPCSVKSETYAFGLILYEILTGKPVFKPKTLDELYDLHKLPKTRPSQLVPELDPMIDEVIMRCLEEDPEKRPDSIAIVLGALPGGDALARAIALGQTPSPQLLAASGGCAGMPRHLALLSATFILLGLLASALLTRHAGLIPRVPLDKPLPALDDRAQTLLADLGYRTQGMYKASDFDIYERLLWTIADRDNRPERWDRLSRSRPAPIDYWYRQGVAPLVPTKDLASVDMWDPPHATAGMVAVRLDPLGRLRELTVVTEPRTPDQPPGAGAWMDSPSALLGPAATGSGAPTDDLVFQAAGLDIASFTAVPAKRIPPVFATERRAWTGTYPDYPDEPIRVELATLHDHVVAFRIIEENWAAASSWATPPLSPEGVVGRTMIVVADVVVLVAGAWLAWRNLHERRGDSTGAAKVAGLVAGLLFLSMILERSHASDLSTEVGIIRDSLLFAVSRGLIAWIGYVALEPVVRRLWPRTLVGWSRAMAGKFQDPMMGRCVMIGISAGIACAIITAAENLAPGWVGQPPPVPIFDKLAGINALESAPAAVGALLAITVQWIGRSMIFLLGLALVGLCTPRRRFATIAYASIAVVAWTLSRHAMPGAGPWWSTWIGSTLIVGIATYVMVWRGLLAAVIAGVTFHVLIAFPVPANSELWYWGTSFTVLVGLALAVGMATYIVTEPSARVRARSVPT